MQKWKFALSLAMGLLFVISCAQKSSPNAETAFTPQVQTNNPPAPSESPQAGNESVEKAGPKAAKKARRAPRAAMEAPSQQTMQPAERQLTELAPATPPQEIPREAAAEVVPQEASPQMGGFFVEHFGWIVGGLGMMSAAYLIVAWRRKKTS